jgi:hypothetical protein
MFSFCVYRKKSTSGLVDFSDHGLAHRAALLAKPARHSERHVQPIDRQLAAPALAFDARVQTPPVSTASTSTIRSARSAAAAWRPNI